jgi:hypothetical protein
VALADTEVGVKRASASGTASAAHTLIFGAATIEPPGNRCPNPSRSPRSPSESFAPGTCLAKRTRGAAVLFGSSPYHHVEAAIGEGTGHTIGHGS